MIVNNLAMSLVVCLICRCMSDIFFLRWPWVCSFLPDFTCASPLCKNSVQIHVYISEEQTFFHCYHSVCRIYILHWNFGMASFVGTSSTIKSRATCTAIFLASLYVLLSAALFPAQPGPGNKVIFHAHIIYLCMYTVTCT